MNFVKNMWERLQPQYPDCTREQEELHQSFDKCKADNHFYTLKWKPWNRPCKSQYLKLTKCRRKKYSPLHSPVAQVSPSMHFEASPSSPATQVPIPPSSSKKHTRSSPVAQVSPSMHFEASPHLHGKYRWRTSPQEGFLDYDNTNMHTITPPGNPKSFQPLREAAQRAHLLVLVTKPNNDKKLADLKHMLTICDESLRPEIQAYIDDVQKIMASHEKRIKKGGRRRQRNSSYR
jgi:hypothetical protein